MDAKDRLRLYLEQRRELGESELVLDALPVDEVLRMLGAPKSSAAPNTSAAPARDAVQPPPPLNNYAREQNSYAPPPPPIPAAPATPLAQREPPPAGNWRDVLKSSTAPGVVPPSVAGPVSQEAVALPAWLVNLGIPAGLSAMPAASAQISPALASLESLEAVAQVIAGCRACSLGATALNPVPGEGNPVADFVCVGEAPGQNEDESGRPFIGAAGQLLTKILGAIELPRDEVFICNVLKHRPPGNRNPAPDEVRACTPYLTRQLQLLRPKVILALGTFAAQTLLNTTTALGKLRGQVHSYQGIPLIVTYHPAALLRNESWKRPTWDDVKLARRILDAARAASATAQ